MNYQVSIIMPVYNAEQFLDESIRSILLQSIGFENLQIIAVDDCSTDGSYKILLEYAQNYPNIEVYRTEENTGAAGIPRNIGLQHAQAPYVMFLDPDDFYLENACEILYRKIEETKAEIVGGRFYVVDAEGKNPLRGEFDFPEKETRYELPDDLNKLICWTQPIWQRIFSISFIRQKKILFSKGYGQDMVFLNQCYVNGCSLIQVGDFVVNYRMQSNSVTHQRNKKYFEGYLICTSEFRRILKSYPQALSKWLHIEANSHFNALISSSSLGKEEIKSIFCECKDLFIDYLEGNEDYAFLCQMIREGLFEEAAKYALKCRACNQITERLEGERTAHNQSLSDIRKLRTEYSLITKAYERVIEQLESERTAHNQSLSNIQQLRTECALKTEAYERITEQLESERAAHSQCLSDIQRIKDECTLKVVACEKEQLSIVEAYENRLSSRLIRAIREKRYVDMLKIIFSRIQRKNT